MIIDGRMPTPEQAEAQLRERLAAEQTGGERPSRRRHRRTARRDRC
jgi:hypothetical protein